MTGRFRRNHPVMHFNVKWIPPKSVFAMQCHQVDLPIIPIKAVEAAAEMDFRLNRIASKHGESGV